MVNLNETKKGLNRNNIGNDNSEINIVVGYGQIDVEIIF